MPCCVQRPANVESSDVFLNLLKEQGDRTQLDTMEPQQVRAVALLPLSCAQIQAFAKHDHRRAGILLLTYEGKEAWWKCPTTDGRLSFSALIDHLSGRAAEIELARHGEISLGVVGIDLRPQISPLQATAKSS